MITRRSRRAGSRPPLHLVFLGALSALVALHLLGAVQLWSTDQPLVEIRDSELRLRVGRVAYSVRRRWSSFSSSSSSVSNARRAAKFADLQRDGEDDSVIRYKATGEDVVVNADGDPDEGQDSEPPISSEDDAAGARLAPPRRSKQTREGEAVLPFSLEGEAFDNDSNPPFTLDDGSGDVGSAPVQAHDGDDAHARSSDSDERGGEDAVDEGGSYSSDSDMDDSEPDSAGEDSDAYRADTSADVDAQDSDAETVTAHGNGLNGPDEEEFGSRNELRPVRLARSQRLRPGKKFKDPVFGDPGDDLLPFREKYVSAHAKKLPRLQLEVDYLRLTDELGLVDTGWSDELVLSALQDLVDIWAQANIRLRIHRKEALQYVQLSRARSLAYWYYTDYPRGNLTRALDTVLTGRARDNATHVAAARADLAEREARRAHMKSRIGSEQLARLRAIDTERQGLFDWIVGWPAERTPWEAKNVASIYPVFYYFYMNGGGERGATRVRAGDCKTVRYVDGWPVRCLGFQPHPVLDSSLGPQFYRQWEKLNFTYGQAVRLLAHEMGHALGLRHPHLRSGQTCKYYSSWSKGELMAQVRAVSVRGFRCRNSGFPYFARQSTFLTEDNVLEAREKVRWDLRQTPVVPGAQLVGGSTEQLSTSCKVAGAAKVIVFTQLPSPVDGFVWRVRWKSSSATDAELLVAVVTEVSARINQTAAREGELDKHELSSRQFQVRSLSRILPHENYFVHHEHDVLLSIRKGDYVAIAALNSRSRGIRIAQRVHKDDSVLVGDVIPSARKSRHPMVADHMHSVDRNLAYPRVLSAHASQEAFYYSSAFVTGMSKRGKIFRVQRVAKNKDACAPLIFNYDVRPQ